MLKKLNRLFQGDDRVY